MFIEQFAGSWVLFYDFLQNWTPAQQVLPTPGSLIQVILGAEYLESNAYVCHMPHVPHGVSAIRILANQPQKLIETGFIQ